MNVLQKAPDVTLSVRDLADALYAGTPHLRDLAEKLAFQHGDGAGPLVIFELMPEDVQNFWLWVAQMLIDHSRNWRATPGGVQLLPHESDRLRSLPRHPALAECAGVDVGAPTAGPEISNQGFDVIRDGFNACGTCGCAHPPNQPCPK